MQEKQNNITLVWFRNDLRVHDNHVLVQAIQNSSNVLAVYCFDPRHFEMTPYGFKKTEQYRAKFLLETVTNLKANLNRLNIELLTYHDYPESVIPKIVEHYDIQDIFLQKEWTQEEVSVLNSVISASSSKLKTNELYNQFLYHPEDIHMEFDDIPKVFTNFRIHLEKNCTIRPCADIPKQHDQTIEIQKTSIPSLEELGYESFVTHANSAFPFKGGETEALKRLNDYVFKTRNISTYKKTRNGLIGKEFSSKLSSWLANGSLSPRMIYWEVKRFENEHVKNDSTYWLVFELLWRDYFKYIALKHGNAIFKLGGILNRNYEWRTDNNVIDQWKCGLTPEPFVNANMIELNKTGWMGNRGRQNVASYFAKDLKLDWRIGAAYFESLLIDYDVHSNYGNWMYVAGVGNDPRDRKFNVKLQADRYDHNGTYQNLWLQQTLFE